MLVGFAALLTSPGLADLHNTNIGMSLTALRFSLFCSHWIPYTQLDWPVEKFFPWLEMQTTQNWRNPLFAPVLNVPQPIASVAPPLEGPIVGVSHHTPSSAWSWHIKPIQRGRRPLCLLPSREGSPGQGLKERQIRKFSTTLSLLSLYLNTPISKQVGIKVYSNT